MLLCSNYYWIKCVGNHYCANLLVLYPVTSCTMSIPTCGDLSAEKYAGNPLVGVLLCPLEICSLDNMTCLSQTQCHILKHYTEHSFTNLYIPLWRSSICIIENEIYQLPLIGVFLFSILY